AGPAVDIAQSDREADILAPGRVQIDGDIGRVRGARALQPDDTVGKAVKFGDSAGRERVRIAAIGVYVDDRAGAGRGARILAGSGNQAIAAIADDAGNSRPIVIGGDQARIAPVLKEV